MRYLQIFIQKVTSLAVIAAGVLLVMVPLHQIFEFIGTMVDRVPYFGPLHMVLRIAGGVVLCLIGLVALLPLLGGRRKRTIAFEDTRGAISIELESVENALDRAALHMPEVKRVTSRVLQADGERVRISAKVLVYNNVGAREAGRAVRTRLAEVAKKVLGVEDVSAVIETSIYNKPMPGSTRKTKVETTPVLSPAEEPAVEKTGFSDEDFILPPHEGADHDDADVENEEAEDLVLGGAGEALPSDDDEESDQY